MPTIRNTLTHAGILLLGLALTWSIPASEALAEDELLPQSETARNLDSALNWDAARLIVVQDANRYKTLDSFARERMSAMTGKEHLPGLSPLASLLEWLFNADSYAKVPLIRIRDKGIRVHLAAHMDADERERIIDTGYMTPRELASGPVQARMNELEPKNIMVTAMRRVREAEGSAFFIDHMLRIVPSDDPEGTALWHAPRELFANLPPEAMAAAGHTTESFRRRAGDPVPGVTQEHAAAVLGPFLSLQKAWRNGDAEAVQAHMDELAGVLPEIAPAGVYPNRTQREAEATYYHFGKFTWGWALYFLGALVSIWALVTRWRVPRVLGILLLLAAMGVHTYGIGLRWYILGRIPVANMFEAVIFSALVGIAVALAVELIYRTRVFLVGAHVTGFLALVLGGYVIPGGGTLTSIMGILDDVMLRIHTVLIIASYALIFLAAVIAIVYLLGYYFSARTSNAPAPALAYAGGGGGAVLLGPRPILAGGAPGDEKRRNLPPWLNNVDWSHMIILNMMFVMLFVGIILGAVWADYSWGRPWGWDPKEVFALNTWIVYAILIHSRFVVKNKGLWTAWLSVAGCLMMAFNWCFVNFYIVGLHSYA